MTKWEPKEERIEKIVTAAIEVFLEKGYDGASMEKIADRAQMSKGGLYHHFKSKEEILFYANEKLCEPVYCYLQEAMSKGEAAVGIQFYIRNYLEYWCSHIKEVAFFFLTMTKALSCPENWHIYEEYFNLLEAQMTNLFQRGIEQGDFVNHDAKTSALTLLAALDGVLVYLIMNPAMEIEETIHQMTDQFIISKLSTDSKQKYNNMKW